MQDRGARRLFFYLYVTAVTAPGLIRLVEAETAYRAAIRVVQTSAEIEPYLAAVITQAGPSKAFPATFFRATDFFLLIPSLVTYICQMAVRPREFVRRLRCQPRPPF